MPQDVSIILGYMGIEIHLRENSLPQIPWPVSHPETSVMKLKFLSNPELPPHPMVPYCLRISVHALPSATDPLSYDAF